MNAPNFQPISALSTLSTSPQPVSVARLEPTRAAPSRLNSLYDAAQAVSQARTRAELQEALVQHVPRVFPSVTHISLTIIRRELWQTATLLGDLVSAQPADGDPILVTTKKRHPVALCAPVITGTFAAFGAVLIVPLEGDGAVFGTLNLATTGHRVFTADDVQLAALFTLQVAAALRSFERLEALDFMQNELVSYAIRLETSNEELAAYGYTIAHDLKTPLHVINGYAHLLRTLYASALDAEGVAALATIEQSVAVMARMIDQLLFLAKVRADEQPPEPVDMLAGALMASERFRKALAERQIAFTVEHTLPDALGHAIWIEEVFANLIGNAVKYIGEDNPAPAIHVSAETEPDGWVRYRVRDNGVGISESDQNRLFRMFSRLHGSTMEGTGLGLAIVHRIVTRLGGRVGVESAVGQGSTFWFTLPAAHR